MGSLSLDLLLFLLCIAFTVWLGFWVARRKTVSAKDYFLARKRLPWYAIRGSIIAANISTDFIGMVGAAYAAAFVLAQWEWGNWITFSALIWIFLPYYFRGGIYTMPEFLERRYHKICRYIFAVASPLLWIVAQMAVVMLAGSRVMEAKFSFPPLWTILILAVLAASYTIYGGLVSVAWTDFMQFLVVMIGGMLVACGGQHMVFTLIQNVGAWIAAPISAIVMISVWLAKRAPTPDQIRGMIWSRQYTQIPVSEASLNRGGRNLFQWWALFIGRILALYGYLTWFQFRGQVSTVQG